MAAVWWGPSRAWRAASSSWRRSTPGTIELDTAQIATIETEAKVQCGPDIRRPACRPDRLVGSGQLPGCPDRGWSRSHLGRQDRDHLVGSWQEPESPGDGGADRQGEADFRPSRPSGRRIFEAGLFLHRGEQQRLPGPLAAREAIRKSAKDLLKFFVSAEYSEEDDVRSTSEVKGGAYYEYLFTERFFGFSRLDLEYDEFENLDLRASVGVGVGVLLDQEGGPRAEDPRPASATSMRVTWMALRGTPRRLKSASTIASTSRRGSASPSNNTWYPTFESLRDYRLVSDNAFLIPLGDSDIWKLKLGALYEYDSIPNRVSSDSTRRTWPALCWS